MSKAAKLFTVVMVIASLVFIPLGSAFADVNAQEEDISSEAMMADMLVVRPVGLVSYVAGCAFYLISLPFSALGGNVDEAAQKLVKDPAEFTFKRPLGDF